MVETQENTKNMENLNIIIEINEDGEMANFDIALRNTELPYENTDEYEYVVEEFEKVKEVNHKKFRCLLARELNCFACTAIYRFQLIFVRRKRKVVEYVPTTRNSIVTTSPVPIVRQTQQYQIQQPQQQQQHVVKVVTPKIVSVPVVKNNVKTVPVRNTVTYQQSPPQQANRVVIAQQQAQKKEEDASRLRQMLEKRQQLQKQNAAAAAAAAAAPKRFVATKQQNIAQRIVYSQPKTVVTVPDIGSSEEDIETEVIDSSMVEVEMTSNSNSPLPAAVKQQNNKSKVVVQREPIVSVMDDSKETSEANPLKCDLCNKEFHSLRQRERHRVTHTSKDSTSSTGRNKTLSLSEEGTSSPTHTSNKQSPNIVTKAATTTVKRTGQVLKRMKLLDPLEDHVMEVTTAGEDSEN